MSCHGHFLEAFSRKLRVTLTVKNVTIEEIAAIKQFLANYRKEHKTQ